MTTKEFIYSTGEEFKITLELNGWCARFTNLSQWFGGGFGGRAGFGITPNLAVKDYFKEINKKTLVKDPKGPNEKFFAVPEIEDLT